ncbi:enoyl-CoA hydratase [Amycolatopsis sp. K13G38]|uniref:Enoyl-CoA hydratase n=1 Tax=Amycolatopsis acididurans TaxID=2724524 RepID=A0ABX1J8Q4_9PSEU|nr:enoyl-CoA hydratase-related protein [Amycolatopsis acididurans]NKQ56175.1 enoyl-CoA hydratase [Amycolatopsis acididurans]
MAGEGPAVRYEVRAGIAHIRLNRPEVLNAWTPDLGRELLAAVQSASADPDVRCGLVTGAGRAFSAGADVNNAREVTPEGAPDLSVRLLTIYNPIALAIRGSRTPFITAVQGACAGLGVSLALASDVVIAAEDAFFLLAFIKLALSPDGGVTAFLTERVGTTRAAELCLLGERLDARRAQDWGLVRSVHAVDELAAVGEELAARIAAADADVIGRAKRNLGLHRLPVLRRHLELEARMQHRHGMTHDYSEGRAAFAEKRPPEFTGS